MRFLISLSLCCSTNQVLGPTLARSAQKGRVREFRYESGLVRTDFRRLEQVATVRTRW